MRSLPKAEFDKRIKNAKVLERQQSGLSALRSTDGRIIKIWQRQGGLSSDRLRPYSKRFADNCQALNERGIPAPQVEDRFRIPETGEHVLIYPLLPGRPLLDLAQEGQLPYEALAAFYARLHDKGVLFRSIHLGNVLQLDDGRLGLIDVTDCSFYSRRLGTYLRAQNIGYAWAYRGDHKHFDMEVRQRMLACYLETARLSDSKVRRFKTELRQALAHYDARRKRKNAAHRRRKQKQAAKGT